LIRFKTLNTYFAVTIAVLFCSFGVVASEQNPLTGKGLHCKCLIDKPQRGKYSLMYGYCEDAATTLLFEDYADYEILDGYAGRLTAEAISTKGPFLLSWRAIRNNDAFKTISFYSEGVRYSTNSDFIIWDKYALSRESLTIQINGDKKFPSKKSSTPIQQCKLVSSYAKILEIQKDERAQRLSEYQKKLEKNKL